jgi:hypothetical protein
MAAMVSLGEQEEVAEQWTPAHELIHWVAIRHLAIEQIMRDMEWKDALRLAFSSPQLWPHVERLVALTKPDMRAALNEDTSDRLRIPLLTGLTPADARADNNWALRKACAGGHLAAAQWLTERFGLTAADARAWHNEVLWWACRNGHLEVAQWLTERFGLTAADVRAADNEALRWACANGHLDVAQWLTEEFGITQEEINKK